MRRLKENAGEVMLILALGTTLLFCGMSYLKQKLAHTRTVDTVENPAPAPWEAAK